MPSKYDPLTTHLRKALSNMVEVTMTVSDIVAIVGDLPASAKKASWWANACAADTPLPHVKAWTDADCFVFSATPKSDVVSVTFHQGKSNHGNGFVKAAVQRALPHDQFSLEWSWLPVGDLSRSTLSKHPSAKLELSLPEPPTDGGVYCFRMELSGPRSYVGKTDDFRRRLLQYRSATGKTEQLVECALHGAFDSGTVPKLLVITAATARLGSESWSLDMADDLNLVLLEHAAVACERKAGRTVINRVR